LQDGGKVEPTAIAADTVRQQVPAVGAVVFTATEPRVWVKFYDAAGNQLFQKEMVEGERYALPADAEDPLLWTARADALEITVGGKSVARLSDKPVILKDVPVSREALLARSSAVTRGAAAPASRETIGRPPRAASEPDAAPVPFVRPQPGASPHAASNGSNGAAAPRPVPAASPAVPAPRAMPSTAPAPVTTPGADRASVPGSEPVSADFRPASTVSD
jgi:cytoskeleton protein RodZ